MDRRTLEVHLALAKSHVDKGEEHLAAQRGRIGALEAVGYDSADAHGLLAVLEQSQALHVAERDRLEAELSTADNLLGEGNNDRS